MEAKKEFDRAQEILMALEDILINQKEPYLLHIERLAGLKYLHDRLSELMRLETMAAQMKADIIADVK